MNGRLEVLFQSGLQFDGMMEGKWLVSDPCALGGKINSQWSELTSWGQAGMGKTLWGGGAPPRLYEMVKAVQEKSAAAEQHGDRSKSGFLIFLVLTDRRRSRLQSVILPFFGKGKKRWNDAGGWKWRGTAGSSFKGSIRGEGKATFWQLELRWRKKRVG